MDKNSKKDLNKNKISSKTTANISKKKTFKEEKSPFNTIKSIKKGKKIMEENKIPNQKNQNTLITIKKYSMDNKELNVNTNNINTISGTNTSDILLDKKNILKIEIYNNKMMIIKPNYQEKEYLKENTLQHSNENINIKNNIYKIKISEKIDKNSKERKNSKENFGTIILQKKMKLFSFSDKNEDNKDNNNNIMNMKESSIDSISSKNIKHDNKENPIQTEINENTNQLNKKKLIISVKKLDNREKKVSYKKLKLDLIKDNNNYNGENNEKEKIKLETKINKNREILFKSQNETSKRKKKNISQNGIEIGYNMELNKQKINIKNKSPKKENIDNIVQKKLYIIKTNNNKLYNSNKNLTKKEKKIELSKKVNKEDKNEIDKNKVINIKKNISPIKINIDLDNNSSNYINDKFPDKVFFSSERNSSDNQQTNILLKTFKYPKIKKKNKIIKDDIKEKKENNHKNNENEIIKEENNGKLKKSKNKNIDFNIETFSPNRRKENKKRKIDNNNLIFPLNTMEINLLKRSTINKLLKNNHYKALFTDIPMENFNKTKKLNNKKKYRFSERKKNETNKDLRARLTESNENYYDLYKKAFNDTSLEQKFSFRPKMNKRYFNYEYDNINHKIDDENNKTYDNNKRYNKKISSISFNPKWKRKIESDKNLSFNVNKKELDNSLNIENKKILDRLNDNFMEDINNKDIDEFDNNKNAILDLNHFIPIDKNKLIKTFAKPLFNDKNA